MRNAVTDSQPVDSRWNWLCKVSGAAALMAGILLLAGMLSLLSSVLPAGGIGGWLSAFQHNWLIVVFKLHAGLHGAQAVLALVAITYLGLYMTLRRSSRIWSVIAAIQPFLGILLFVATKTAGRSAVMGAGLVASLVMLRSPFFRKTTAYLGVATRRATPSR